MKNLLIAILAVATMALGALNLVQAHKASRQNARMTSLEIEVQQRGEQITELEQAQEAARQRQAQLVKLSEDMAAGLQKRLESSNAPGQNPAADAGGSESTVADSGKGFSKMLAGMMEDPDIKKMIRDQQRGMLDPLYAPFIKQMKLSPEEAEAFKSILAENMARASDQAGALFGSATNRAEAFRRMAEQQKQTEEQIKSLLGDERYAAYQDYQLTVGERTQLNMFRQQNAGERPITDSQSEQLLAIMREEKQNLAQAGQPFGGAGNDAQTMESMFSSEQGERLLQAQELASERVFERARNVLDEEQLKAFGSYQTNQLRMMKMGMDMSRRFLAPAQPEN